MINNFNQSDRIILSVFVLAFAAAFLPGLIFFGLIYGATLIFKKKLYIYVFFSAGALVDIFYMKNFQDLFLKYFNNLWSFYKGIYYGRFSGIDILTMIKVGLPAGLFMFLMLKLYLLTIPEWIKKKNKAAYSSEISDKYLKKLESLEYPESSTVVGVDDKGNIVEVTDEELNGHCLILGATGAGKTTTLMNFVESAVRRSVPLILVDGKGEKDFPYRVKAISEKYERKFCLFSMNDENSMHYNPLRHGNFTELKDKLISITEWSEQHYKLMAERYLQSAIRMLQIGNHDIDLVNIANKLDANDLVLMARNYGVEGKIDQYELSRFKDMIDNSKKDIGGLINRLAVFSESEIGELLRDTKDESTIDLINAVNEDAVVFFSLDSLRFAEYSRLLGRLIVIDLKTTAARMFGNDKKVFVIFDEFGVFAGPQVTDFINKSRAAGFHVILSTQELADLRIDGKAELMEQILGNTNVKIIHRQDVPSSAELLSSLIGTDDDIMVTHQVNGIETTGMGTIKEEKSFIVHPDEIKRLKRGEAFVVKKFPSFFVDKAWVKKL